MGKEECPLLPWRPHFEEIFHLLLIAKLVPEESETLKIIRTEPGNKVQGPSRDQSNYI